jgi:hypothetical protein
VLGLNTIRFYLRRAVIRASASRAHGFEDIMLTIFSTPKPFVGHNNIIQRNASSEFVESSEVAWLASSGTANRWSNSRRRTS